jgi:hypothetical protein
MAGELQKDVATLLERSTNIQEDVAEIKKLVQIQNGRVRKLEEEMLSMQASKKVVLAITAGMASIVTFIGNLFLADWLRGR